MLSEAYISLSDRIVSAPVRGVGVLPLSSVIGTTGRSCMEMHFVPAPVKKSSREGVKMRIAILKILDS